jgi:predicted adenylyl cyclase CyaB
MARNVEIKARVADLDAVRRNASSLGDGPIEIIDQTDTFFRVAHGRLKVREFADGSGEVIAYERANSDGPRESIYTRVACADAGALVQILGRLWPVRGVVRKRRELLMIGRTRVHLDEVEGLGTFLELEVVMVPDEPAEQGDAEARRLLRTLKIPQTAFVREAYIDLLESAAAKDAAT